MAAGPCTAVWVGLAFVLELGRGFGLGRRHVLGRLLYLPRHFEITLHWLDQSERDSTVY